MRIGELAKAAQTQSETIRYYERQGLLPEAERSHANYRVYSARHIQRLAFIRHCRTLDMTLGEIRTLLHFKDAPEENCAEVNGLLDEHIGHVAVRIRELKALREQCVSSQTAADCGILSSLEKAAQTSVRDSTNQGHSGHVHGSHRQIGL